MFIRVIYFEDMTKHRELFSHLVQCQSIISQHLDKDTEFKDTESIALTCEDF